MYILTVAILWRCMIIVKKLLVVRVRRRRDEKEKKSDFRDF